MNSKIIPHDSKNDVHLIPIAIHPPCNSKTLYITVNILNMQMNMTFDITSVDWLIRIIKNLILIHNNTCNDIIVGFKINYAY